MGATIGGGALVYGRAAKSAAEAGADNPTAIIPTAAIRNFLIRVISPKSSSIRREAPPDDSTVVRSPRGCCSRAATLVSDRSLKLLRFIKELAEPKAL